MKSRELIKRLENFIRTKLLDLGAEDPVSAQASLCNHIALVLLQTTPSFGIRPAVTFELRCFRPRYSGVLGF